VPLKSVPLGGGLGRVSWDILAWYLMLVKYNYYIGTHSNDVDGLSPAESYECSFELFGMSGRQPADTNCFRESMGIGFR
jgi:hypothetical protein